MLKRLILGALLLGSIAVGIGAWMYFKPHRNIKSAEPDFTLSAEAWGAEFSQNDTLAHQKYAEKVLLLEGSVRAIENADTLQLVELNSDALYTVSCLMDPQSAVPAKGESIQFKCLYAGYMKPDTDFELPGAIQCISCTLQSNSPNHE